MVHAPPSNSLSWNLQIPIGLMLQARPATGEPHFKCRYLGMKPGEFLILQTPETLELRENPISCCQLTLHVFLSGKTYSFCSTVLDHTLRPVPLLFISFPNALEALDSRRTDRIDTIIECETKIDGQLVRGVILDLSAEGCRIAFEHLALAHAQLVQPGGILQLRFRLAENTPETTVICKVVASKTDDRSTEIGVLFLFDQCEPEAEKQLQFYVNSVLPFKPNS